MTKRKNEIVKEMSKTPRQIDEMGIPICYEM